MARTQQAGSSTYDSRSDQPGGHGSAYQDFLRKPFSPAELFAAVDQQLRR